ncbi:MAG: hypothetical protein KDB71_13440 [Mycobacterium sp.]|nr:hypothetical protein [Mycobacterium sp.]
MLKMRRVVSRSLSNATVVGACVVLPATAVAGPASADPINPYNPEDCMANVDVICDLGPYGPDSAINPLNPDSPMSPMNPDNPASPMSPTSPMNP